MKYCLFVGLLMLLFPLGVVGQSMSLDAVILLDNSLDKYEYSYYDESHGNDVDLMKNRKNKINTYNPLVFILKPFMFLYQNGISPQLLSHCQHEMTCSNFSKNVIHEYGIVKGIFLTSDRLMRDNSYCISEYPEFKVSENEKGIDEIHDFRIK
jgi:putative component of membrane protein insertase Oxa1/YidC/SpoIIIJ protein YidD